MARYDRYDRDSRNDRQRFTPPYAGWYPGAFWAGAPMYGWDGAAGGWPPYLGGDPFGYDREMRGREPGRPSPGPNRYDAPLRIRGYDRFFGEGGRANLRGPDRMRYDRDHYDPRGAHRYDERHFRSWDRWW